MSNTKRDKEYFNQSCALLFFLFSIFFSRIAVIALIINTIKAIMYTLIIQSIPTTLMYLPGINKNGHKQLITNANIDDLQL